MTLEEERDTANATDTFGDEEKAASTGNEDNPPSSPTQKNRRRKIIFLAPAVIFSSLFVISFSVELYDSNYAAAWLAFYALHAVLAISVLIFSCANRLPAHARLVLGGAAALLVWSIHMIVITSVDLARTEHGGEVKGGDINSATEREEKAFEVGGSTLGMVSAAYAMFLVKVGV
eukprot:CAMPEP_0183303300 /NCGR_PEP_ID=MMETSP0160_2-20130417/8792_1 /TAXON_ID=2839 ORGANISM="Odontella Sinensis, Strain Grunow 1884" /NCGR_SAMPLE_ID=MMETSP0160_2 /ASSEMBLY_ACC=CAM_ASM_000250 /LENGTH=174 /DNA_ID=CAMNT_0025466187 /DNA_START=34 /DNA_END=558 /DNA_ORIENTATION=-